MFHIRGISDCDFPANRKTLDHVQVILKTQFPSLSEDDVNTFRKHLTDPPVLSHPTLYAACDPDDNVLGFALLLHFTDLNFYFLEYLSAAKDKTGNGLGGALYETVRRNAASTNPSGLFFECLPDDPALCHDAETLKCNTARLRFYEKHGARPIINTKYETILDAEDDNPPYLVYDDIGLAKTLGRDTARSVVKAILERKYADICSPEYVEKVVSSLTDDPIKLREPRYAPTPEKVTLSSYQTVPVQYPPLPSHALQVLGAFKTPGL
ncbi:MAG: hypothetical protein ABH834_04115 [Candidatus Altiarchaeota archaeon]